MPYPEGGPPVQILIGGGRLTSWTTMSLTRSKKEATGSLTVTIFYGYLPDMPQIRAARAGAPIHVYIGGNLAFTGTIDKRGGKSKKPSNAGQNPGKGGESGAGEGGGSVKTHIGPDKYEITITARGKAKNIVDSSQVDKTSTKLNAKTRDTAEQLVKPFGVQIDWRGPNLDMDKMRFRDGGRVINDINRICSEYGFFRHEDRFGRLRITEMAGPETGEALILGDNILEFDAEQSEDGSHSDIAVKGQRTKKGIRGREAIDRIKRIKDKAVQSFRPLTIQHYTDGTDEALDRRARYEANARSSDAQEVKIKVFHVMPRSGGAWDIGMLHYVEVPPEGIFDVFECTGLTYTVNAQNTLTTELTLNPPPNSPSSGGSSGALAGIGMSDFQAQGRARRAQAGITLEPGIYPAPWTGADIVDQAVGSISALVDEVLDLVDGVFSFDELPPATYEPGDDE